MAVARFMTVSLVAILPAEPVYMQQTSNHRVYVSEVMGHINLRETERVWVCICLRERQRQRETDRQTQRERASFARCCFTSTETVRTQC